ncbi:MAG: hypothetical protein HY721_34550 [Planctomycetes bacterium]|nr:hypothetical protein [Planctomycetota bacterium]
MKTSVDIPDDELKKLLRYTRAKTKRDAIVTAISDFNRRRRMAEVASHFGTCRNLMSHADLMKLRRMD